jgi:hypothetical protein
MYQIIVQLNVEAGNSNNTDQGSHPKEQRTLVVPYHPLDTLEMLRLRIYSLLLSDGLESSHVELPIGFEIRYYTTNQSKQDYFPSSLICQKSSTRVAEAATEVGEKGMNFMMRCLKPKPFSKPFIWYPAKYPTLQDALVAAKIDHRGDYSIHHNDGALLTSLTSSSSSSSINASVVAADGTSIDATSVSGAAGTPSLDATRRYPVLVSHGSSVLPLRACALADSLGAIPTTSSSSSSQRIHEDSDKKRMTALEQHRSCNDDDETNSISCSLPSSSSSSSSIFYTQLPSKTCPLTNIEGLTAFHGFL